MADPQANAARQLRNIETSTGMTVAEFARLVEEQQLDRHSEIVGYLKSEHGLTHGNANLLAHTVRERAAGGPADPERLLGAQYANNKEPLRPIYERLADVAAECGDDVTIVVQKTGVSFRRAKQFALVRAPSVRRVELGLNLRDAPPNDRARAASGMCTHRIDLSTVDEIDDEVIACVTAAYAAAG